MIKNATTITFACLLACGLLVSCADEGDDSWQRLGKEAGEAAEAAGDALREGANQLGAELASRLEGLDEKFAELEKHLKAKSGDLKAGLKERWDSTREMREDVGKTMKEAGQDARDAMATKLDELEEMLRGLEKRLAEKGEDAPEESPEGGIDGE